MAKKYVNGRWVTVEDTTTGGTANNASTGVLPQRDTPTEVESSSSGSSDSKDQTSESEYEETAYDIVEGTINVTVPDMGIKCRDAIELEGLGSVFSSVYYISEVKVSVNSTSMNQTLVVHKDSLGVKSKTQTGSSSTGSTRESLSSVSVSGLATREYTVKYGDTLYIIALKQLGKGSRWTEIYEMNKSIIGSNPNLIYPGQVFSLPSS